MPAGRPSSYTDEIADEICRRIGLGEPLLKICAEPGQPERRTVHRWLETNEEFRLKYARAREMQADAFADDCIRIADAAHDKDSAAAARVQVDARKWYAGKIRPKVYGDRVIQEHEGEIIHRAVIDRPPDETREQWVERQQQRLLIVGPPARTAD